MNGLQNYAAWKLAKLSNPVFAAHYRKEIKRMSVEHQGSLTAGEKAVVATLFAGYNYQETAELLGISHSCIRDRMRQIGKKLEIPKDRRRHMGVVAIVKIHDMRHILGVKCEACD